MISRNHLTTKQHKYYKQTKMNQRLFIVFMSIGPSSEYIWDDHIPTSKLEAISSSGTIFPPVSWKPDSVSSNCHIRVSVNTSNKFFWDHIPAGKLETWLKKACCLNIAIDHIHDIINWSEVIHPTVNNPKHSSSISLNWRRFPDVRSLRNEETKGAIF